MSPDPETTPGGEETTVAASPGAHGVPGGAAPPAGAASPAKAAVRPNRRKVREGIVVSDKMDKTAVVEVRERVRHPRYGKIVQRTKRLYVHDPANEVHVGDRVKVAETRPLSRLKRWRVVEVMERAR